jgi:hypothetical protein
MTGYKLMIVPQPGTSGDGGICMQTPITVAWEAPASHSPVVEYLSLVVDYLRQYFSLVVGYA